MVDYWVSKERHFCQYCNVWMQGDKLSIKHHEQGRKHKDMVQETMKLKRKAKSDAYHADKDLQEQLREIEEAAQAKFATDMAGKGAAPPPPPGRGRSGAAPPPPPPRRPSGPGGNGGRGRGGGSGRGGGGGGGRPMPPPQEAELEEELEKEDDNGVYAIRGNVYLDGRKHESTLEAGSACQIWVEDADEWVDALIEKAVVHTVPNTDITFRRYTIAYMLPDPAKLVTETDVLVDRLRVKLPEGITLEAAERMVAPDSMSAPPPVDHKIDETTGIGEWSTVEVRTIDESEEAVAQRNAEAEAEEARLAEEQKRLDALEEFTSQGDDAMGAFNPWGGSYKGVALEAPSKVAREEEEIQITTTGSVDFKKRRKADNGKSKKKRIRVETED